MKLKTEKVGDVTYAVLDAAGLPVYVMDDQKEVGFDAPAASNKIRQLNAEAQGHREAKEAAETKLKGFEGIEDPAKALEAIQTVANLNSGELTTAAKVQEIKDAAAKAAEDRVTAAVKAKDDEIASLKADRDGIKTAYHEELIGGGFDRSKYIEEKIAVPRDLMRAQFGRNFKVEDGKLVAYDAAGSKIYSSARPGELASFDEAMESLVQSYPNRAHILKGQVGTGGGAGGGGGGAGGGAVITRKEFFALTPSAQQAKAKEASEGKLQIVD